MTSFVQLAFVTGPATSPTTVLDLTGPTTNWLTIEDFSLGSPSFAAAAHSVGGEYGDREVTFKLKIIATTYAATATLMQNIARQLLAPTNWLMATWQPANKPMFLRTYRTQQDDVDWTLSRAGVWELPVHLVCDPWIYGAPQTVGPVTVTNDPATGSTNRMQYQFGSILGDAPTPLKVDITPSITWNDFTPLMASVAFDPAETLTAAPFYWQTQAFTLGTDTTLVTGDATYSGSNNTSVSFATDATMTTRLSGVASATLTPGTYKVMCRMQVSTYASSFAVRFGQQTNLVSYTYGDTVTISSAIGASSAFASWYDLGEFTLPVGGNVDIADIGTADMPFVALQAQRLTGSGNLKLDAFVLIPVDTATTVDVALAKTTFSGAGARPTVNGVWDGTKLPPQFRAYTIAGGAMATLRPPRIDGRFLRLTPGLNNVFYLVQQTTPDGPSTSSSLNTDVIGATAAVTFTYYPRYLHIRPDST